MTDRVFTSDLRRATVWLLASEHRYTTEQIADAMLMAPDKVQAILAERAADECAQDQMRALAGPFLPKAGSFDGGA